MSDEDIKDEDIDIVEHSKEVFKLNLEMFGHTLNPLYLWDCITLIFELIVYKIKSRSHK